MTSLCPVPRPLYDKHVFAGGFHAFSSPSRPCAEASSGPGNNLCSLARLKLADLVHCIYNIYSTLVFAAVKSSMSCTVSFLILLTAVAISPIKAGVLADAKAGLK